MKAIEKKPDIPVCITAHTRPDPSHAWRRAGIHILHLTDIPFLVRLQAESECLLAAMAVHRPNVPPSITWGWGKPI